MKFIVLLLVTYVFGCSESQPRTRTQPVKNSAQAGAEDANAATKPSDAGTNNAGSGNSGGSASANNNPGSGNSGGSASANNNPNIPQIPLPTGPAPTSGQANGQSANNNGGAGPVAGNISLGETNPAVTSTNPPTTGPSPTSTPPPPPEKPACPQLPNIGSPINGGDGDCGDACRDKLKTAARYVNGLFTTIPNINIPSASQLQDKIVAKNLFDLIYAAGQKSANVYRTVCNPLAGIKYRP